MLYLVRHGHTALNALREVHGLLDDPLDDEGRAEAAALGTVFAGVSLAAVYASPLQRAVQTAEPIAEATGQPVAVEGGVLDRDYGPWTGHVKAEVVAAFGSVDEAPGVEPWSSFTARVVAAVVRMAAAHRDERVAIVAHDAVNQAVLLALFPGRWSHHSAIQQRNGCWNRLDRAAPSEWTLAVFDAVPGDGQRP